jgi:hypothetical protein
LVGWQSSLLGFALIQRYVWVLMHTIRWSTFFWLLPWTSAAMSLWKSIRYPQWWLSVWIANSLVIKVIPIFLLMLRNATSKLLYAWRTRWATCFIQM